MKIIVYCKHITQARTHARACTHMHELTRAHTHARAHRRARMLARTRTHRRRRSCSMGRWRPCMTELTPHFAYSAGMHGRRSRVIYTIILAKSVCLSVGVIKLQVAILARACRELSQTFRIDRQYILSRVRVSLRPSNCFICENIQNVGEIGSPARVFI